MEARLVGWTGSTLRTRCGRGRTEGAQKWVPAGSVRAGGRILGRHFDPDGVAQRGLLQFLDLCVKTRSKESADPTSMQTPSTGATCTAPTALSRATAHSAPGTRQSPCGHHPNIGVCMVYPLLVENSKSEFAEARSLCANVPCKKKSPL